MDSLDLDALEALKPTEPELTREWLKADNRYLGALREAAPELIRLARIGQEYEAGVERQIAQYHERYPDGVARIDGQPDTLLTDLMALRKRLRPTTPGATPTRLNVDAWHCSVCPGHAYGASCSCEDWQETIRPGPRPPDDTRGDG